LLDGWTLDAPVSAVRVAIVAVAPLSGEQGDLMSTSWRDLGAADAALERLRAELGTGAIVRAEAQDTHRPERAGVWTEILEDRMTGRQDDRNRQEDRKTGRQDDRKPQPGSPVIPLSSRPVLLSSCPPVLLSCPPVPAARRAFDPPEAIEVICDGDTPRSVTWRGQRIAVTRALGPERLSGDWWDDGYRRDYWRCESGVGEMVVFLDRADDAWRMQAWAD
jgi:protein ImuB